RRSGRRRWRDRLRQARRPWPRSRRAAAGALPGRAEARRDGRRLRPLEEAQFLGEGAPDRRGEAGGGAVRKLGFGRDSRRHPRRRPKRSHPREAGEGRKGREGSEEAQEVTGNAAFLYGTPRESILRARAFPDSVQPSGSFEGAEPAEIRSGVPMIRSELVQKLCTDFPDLTQREVEGVV